MVQEMIRQDGNAIRSVVMHSPSIVAAGSESDMSVTKQRLMEHVFGLCKAQPECAAAFPTFEKDFYAVYEELNRNPLDITVDDARGPISIRLDGFRFLRSATNPGTLRVSKMPLLVKELLKGDRIRAATFLLGRRTLPSGAFTCETVTRALS